MAEYYELEGNISPDGKGVTFLHGGMMKRVLAKWVDKPLMIRVEPLRKQRSAQQNRYMHGVIVKSVQAWFLETTGVKYSPDYVYTWLRVELLGENPEVIEMGGREVIVMTGKRFSAMTTKEFAEAVDTILSKMSEKGCYIQEPRRNNLLTDFVTDD